MKAAVLTTYGDPATGLEYRDVPEPGKPGAGQVLVGVEFAPINFSDILVARGLYPLRPDLPSVIGNEIAGGEHGAPIRFKQAVLPAFLSEDESPKCCGWTSDQSVKMPGLVKVHCLAVGHCI
jgi:Zn-dependent alcohol dehydrogenase